MKRMSTIGLEPIGHVKSPEKRSRRGDFDEVISEIILREDLAPGLEGLGEFSHLEVIFYMHLPDEGRARRLKTHPKGCTQLPEVGLFATRSPHRPNRIGLTLCRILSIHGNVIKVKGLDALDGSPILDIRAPSLRYYSKFPEMKFADWMFKLKEIFGREKE